MHAPVPAARVWVAGQKWILKESRVELELESSVLRGEARWRPPFVQGRSSMRSSLKAEARC